MKSTGLLTNTPYAGHLALSTAKDPEEEPDIFSGRGGRLFFPGRTLCRLFVLTNGRKLSNFPLSHSFVSDQEERQMYTVLETSGKQFKVAVGDVIDIEQVNRTKGESISFDRVLMLVGEETLIGKPTLPQVKVTGEVLGEVKGPKILVFKHKRRKDYRKKTGHRQKLTRVAISSIELGQ
jgi:large subunit ribosomal protein L21